ncbi:hypothetical protein H4F05_03125 [Vibrio cholerae]
MIFKIRIKAIPPGIAFLFSFQTLAFPTLHTLPPYVTLHCEHNPTSIHLTITALPTIPSGSKIKLQGTNTIQSSLSPGSRVTVTLDTLPVTLLLSAPQVVPLHLSLHQDCTLSENQSR